MPRKAHPWFRNSDGWWYIKINGKQEKLVKGKANKSAAVKRWHELMAECARNPSIESDDQTVASVIDLYLNHISKSRAPRTYDECRRYLQRFAECHGFRNVRDCRPIHLTTWLDSHPEWVSDWTLRSVVGVIHRPFNWAVRQRLIMVNPFLGVRHQPGQPRRPMTDDEFRQLVRATATRRSSSGKPRHRNRLTPGRRFRQVLFFLRYTGTRPSEMSKLTWDEVDLERQVIVIGKHKTTRTQRTFRPRVIPLVPLVVRLLRRIRQQQAPGTEHVFLTARETPWNRHSLGLRIRRLRKKAGLPDDVVLYGIRHQFGTRSIVNGVDLKTLSELMGHTTTRMTEHYIHLAGCQQHLADAMRQAVSPRQDS